AARDTLEERAQQMLLEEEVNETFAPIEDFLTRAPKKLMRTSRGNGFDKIGGRKISRAGPAIIERSLAKKSEVWGVPPKAVDLPMVELDCFYCLHRLVERAAASAEPCVGWEGRMLL